MSLPVVPVGSDGDGLAEAFESIGFAAVVDHGIPSRLLPEVRAAMVDLFAQPDAVKRRHRVRPDDYRGFVPLGFFTPNEGRRPPDRYESFKVQWDCPPDHPAREACDLYGPMRWSGVPSGTRDVIDRYWERCERLAMALLDQLAASLGLDPTGFENVFDAPLSNMTLLHYPPAAVGRTGHGIHPHKDTCVLTILHPDPVGGLEVRTRSGSWLHVDAPPDALVVNVGDMLEIWSGGRFVSTPHRVVNTSGRDRYSAPFFLVPNHDIVVEPLVEPLPGFARDAVAVGRWTAEVWRTNWPGARPSDLEVGTIDDPAL